VKVVIKYIDEEGQEPTTGDEPTTPEETETPTE